MPGRATMNAKRRRAPLKDKNGKLSKPAHNPSIGSMLSLGIAKQTKKAGGNNVCKNGSAECNGPSAK
jgi:hypothetical protein